MSRNPKSVHFKPDPQGSIDPEISWPDGLAYRLGSYHYREIGASVGEGVVIGVPQERLRPYPFLRLNGSVASFIQISWRWSLSVRQAASGLVKVKCFEGEELRSDLDLLFTGMLALPSARLRIYDPDETISMIFSVDGKSMTVTIYANDDDEPSDLEIYLSAGK